MKQYFKNIFHDLMLVSLKEDIAVIQDKPGEAGLLKPNQIFFYAYTSPSMKLSQRKKEEYHAAAQTTGNVSSEEHKVYYVYLLSLFSCVWPDMCSL